MKKKILCIDIDGVICNNTNGFYNKAKPNIQAIKKINHLKKNYYIKIYTARFMGRTSENKSKAKFLGLKLTTDQLKKWGVKYDQLIFGKPSYDYIIDDKSIFFKKYWYKNKINF